MLSWVPHEDVQIPLHDFGKNQHFGGAGGDPFRPIYSCQQPCHVMNIFVILLTCAAVKVVAFGTKSVKNTVDSVL